jgi:hypothetical protein
MLHAIQFMCLCCDTCDDDLKFLVGTLGVMHKCIYRKNMSITKNAYNEITMLERNLVGGYLGILRIKAYYCP